MSYLDELNEAQRQAVEFGLGPLLILAGAGSGKTRVLTYRIAHLIFAHGVHPSEILAVTFTNKAAGEMQARVVELIQKVSGVPVRREDLWVSTFHSACVRILRSEAHHLGYSNQFTIYDDSDQLSAIKACLKEMNVSDSALSPKAIQGRINRLKNDGINCETYQPNFGGFFEDTFVRVFERYTEVLNTASAMDFADLILKTVTLFDEKPHVRDAYRRRFPHLLVDEYQDTNKCQYLLMKQLAGENPSLCVVGDEDQSIYGWRGADITNILNFEKDFPEAKIFKLEQNYRSTRNIIEAASEVISRNTERRDKRLWTGNDDGEQISLLEAYDERDEAHKVVAEVEKRVADGSPLNEIAVFYRTNAQSRVLEEMLRTKGINYRIFGGLKFFARLEVKDALGYLRLISNPDDDVSFRRIVNVPSRKIGAKTVERLSGLATERGISLYRLLELVFAEGEALDLGRSKGSLQKFYRLMEGLKQDATKLLPSDLLNAVLDESSYRRSLIEENTAESQSRLENLAELRQSVVEYELRVGAEDPEKSIRLDGFLEEVALVSEIDKFDPESPSLSMMTIHMAKGLEFDHVFLVGLEEELFPNIRAWEGEDSADVEEERRLFYVGMTRARKKLYLLYAKNRTVFGNSHFRVKSRFLEEVPSEYVDEQLADYFSRRRQLDRPGLPSRRPPEDQDDLAQVYDDMDAMDAQGFEDFEFNQDPDDSGIRQGARIQHPTFGTGVVRELVGADKLLVEFKGRGLKKISLKFGQVKPV